MSDRFKRTKRNFEDYIRKHSNSVTHGVFTPVAILPGEDPREFEALHSVLIKEWAPVGPTEEDAVLSLAKGMWRKGRLQKFLRGKAVACRLDASHPAYDELDALRGFSGVLEFAPDCLDELLSCPFLSDKRKEHLKRKFPRGDFETTAARARAIQNEINSAILPSLERCDKPVKVCFLEAAHIVTQDDFKDEIAVEERIDAMIDRAVKRLVQAKAMKQMLGTSSSNGGSDRTKKASKQ
jgi:hypothetical protein